MKFLVLALALVAVASALPATRPTAQSAEMQQMEQIIAAINSPSTDPSTAVALEALLMELLGANIVQTPAIIEPINPVPVVTLPAPEPQPIVTLPAPAPGPIATLPVSPVEVIDGSPAVVAPVEFPSSPLVQIILNVFGGQDAPAATPVDPAPVVVNPIVVEPGLIDMMPVVDPVSPGFIDVMPVVDPIVPGMVDVMPVVDPVAPGMVDVMPVVDPVAPGMVDVMPVVDPVPETVAVGTLPVAPVNLPEILN